MTRQEFLNQNFDIVGSSPRQLHFGLNKPQYNLTNNDIEFSRPQAFKFVSKREASNPLNPIYKL